MGESNLKFFLKIKLSVSSRFEGFKWSDLRSLGLNMCFPLSQIVQSYLLRVHAAVIIMLHKQQTHLLHVEV